MLGLDHLADLCEAGQEIAQLLLEIVEVCQEVDLRHSIQLAELVV